MLTGILGGRYKVCKKFPWETTFFDIFDMFWWSYFPSLRYENEWGNKFKLQIHCETIFTTRMQLSPQLACFVCNLSNTFRCDLEMTLVWVARVCCDSLKNWQHVFLKHTITNPKNHNFTFGNSWIIWGGEQGCDWVAWSPAPSQKTRSGRRCGGTKVWTP